VDTALTLEETAKRLQSRRYDLAFLETSLGDGEIFQMVRDFRGRDAKTDRMPLIGMLAQAQDGEREHCLLAGMDDCMLKPLDLETIARTMRRWTRKQPQRHHAAEETLLHREMSA
jgi:two-component system capsular synthesis sensor histidine kinase RcsC